MPASLGRNDPCHCGSGKKYKQCCLDKDKAAEREARAEAAAQAPTSTAEPARPHPTARPRPTTSQPWKRGAQNTRGFPKVSTPRKVGSS